MTVRESVTDVHALSSRVDALRADNNRLREENRRLRKILVELQGVTETPSPAYAQSEPSLDAAERMFGAPLQTSTSAFGSALESHVPSVRYTQPPAPQMGIDLGYVNSVPEAELERLPYGLIVLDAAGRVLFYNETESSATGFAAARVVGRNFFQEVAPCTRVQEFEGRFQEFVRGRSSRSTFFDFSFPFRTGTQHVTIGLSHGREPGTINILLIRR